MESLGSGVISLFPFSGIYIPFNFNFFFFTQAKLYIGNEILFDV